MKFVIAYFLGLFLVLSAHASTKTRIEEVQFNKVSNDKARVTIVFDSEPKGKIVPELKAVDPDSPKHQVSCILHD